MSYNAKDWSVFQPEIMSEILHYVKEHGGFEPDHFLELKFHLVKGMPKTRHVEYLNELYARVQGGGLFSPYAPGDISGDIFQEMTLDDVADIYESSIIKDREAKLILFLVCLNNYTDESQTNIGFESVSSAGKSYIALEILSLFPEDDVDKLLYASPKSFFHRFGELVEEDGETPLLIKQEHVAIGLNKWEKNNPQPERGEPGVKQWREDRQVEKVSLKMEWDKIPKGIRVDLHQRIIVFLDQPHFKLLETLRPVLSHDEKKSVAQFADKDSSGALYAKRVFIIGYPTAIHLTAKHGADEQEKTRMFLLSASVGQEKLQGSIRLLAEKLSDTESFKKKISKDPRRKQLAARILMLREAGISEVIIDKRDMQIVTERFLKEHPRLRPRHQRDFPRLFSLIFGIALLNFANRSRRSRSIVASQDDIEKGYDLYSKISEPNEMGLSPALWMFWKETLSPALDKAFEVVNEKIGDKELMESIKNIGLTRAEFRSLWWEHFGSRIGKHALKETIEALEAVDLIDERSDPDDRRMKIICPQERTVKKDPPLQDEEQEVLSDV